MYIVQNLYHFLKNKQEKVKKGARHFKYTYTAFSDTGVKRKFYTK